MTLSTLYGIMLRREFIRIKKRLYIPRDFFDYKGGNNMVNKLFIILQNRTKVTKKVRLKKKSNRKLAHLGLPIHSKRLPSNFVPKDTPILNFSIPKDRINRTNDSDTTNAANIDLDKMKHNILLRYNFTSLLPEISDRVKKLFHLNNGSQAENFRALKSREMGIFQLRDGDTGSSAVQVMALTTRIQQLQVHTNVHKKDMSSKRGLIALYIRRRKVLDYMEKNDFVSYRSVIKTLSLKR